MRCKQGIAPRATGRCKWSGRRTLGLISWRRARPGAGRDAPTVASGLACGTRSRYAGHGAAAIGAVLALGGDRSARRQRGCDPVQQAESSRGGGRREPVEWRCRWAGDGCSCAGGRPGAAAVALRVELSVDGRADRARVVSANSVAVWLRRPRLCVTSSLSGATRRIRRRDGDSRLSHDAVLLVRANEDSSPMMGLRRAMADAPLCRPARVRPVRGDHVVDLPRAHRRGGRDHDREHTVGVVRYGPASLSATAGSRFTRPHARCGTKLPVCGFPRTRSRVTMRTSWSASIPRINRATTIARRRQCGSSCAPDLTVGIRRLSRCSTRDSDSRRRTLASE